MKNDKYIWTLDELVTANKVKLGRGNIISKRDIANDPGEFPIYSSAREKNGTFGHYGKYMFDEELITWSIDGGGRLFYRPRHKFSVTNVGGTLRILDSDFLDCRYLHLVLTHLHSKISFDWVYKAHPSVIRMVYNEIPIPSLLEQREIVTKLDNAFTEIDKMRVNIYEQIEANLSLLSHSIRNLINDPDVECRNTTLDNICVNLDNKRIPITRDVRASGEYPYYGASGIIDYVEDYIFEGDALLVSEDGANLLARSTPIAFSVSGKYWVNNHAHILKFVDKELQKYVEYLLENTRLDDFITGAAQPKLTQRALNTIPIRIPVDEGDIKQVVAVISSLKDLGSSMSDNLKLRLKLTDELQASLLGKYFTVEEAVA